MRGSLRAMPASWYQSERKDPYERFALAGISLEVSIII
ncbi:hypothetical protein VSVS12_01992 [Vibrio scophthalmi]|nr:hypothetical protein VSVS12_01992 [Vibrio scophthalmi]